MIDRKPTDFINVCWEQSIVEDEILLLPTLKMYLLLKLLFSYKAGEVERVAGNIFLGGNFLSRVDQFSSTLVHFFGE